MENILNKLPFWASLTEQEKGILRKSAVIRRYEKGSFIHSSDRDCLGMLFILSGEIRTYILSDEGREITLFRYTQMTCACCRRPASSVKFRLTRR